MKQIRWFLFLLMIALGTGAGLYYSWILQPVDFVDATFYHLRSDYKADYVLMAAEIFHNGGPLYKAMMQLELLGEDSIDEAVSNAIESGETLGYSAIDMEMLYQLQRAVTGERASATPPIDHTLVAALLTPGAANTQTAAAVLTPSVTPTPDPNVTPASVTISAIDPVDDNPFADSEEIFGTSEVFYDEAAVYDTGEADADDFFRKVN